MNRIRTIIRKLRRRLPRMRVLDTTVGIALVAVAAAIISSVFWLFSGPTVTVHNGKEIIGPASGALTGQPCPGASSRPIAVMLASDREARPLSGIGAADMVFEMPVTPNGITRMMAVFQCGEPREVGSIRSARMDFIPFAQGLDALYAHWGGEHEALALLDKGTLDNVDALRYEGTVYYRKPRIARPHNGFTTPTALREKASELGYSSSASFTPYAHTDQHPERNLALLAAQIAVPWPQGFGVEFRYDAESNRYLRWRGGTPELDALDGSQVSVSVVVVMKTEALPNYDQYIHVRTVGEGDAIIYQGGRRVSARWKKPSPSDMLVFVDAQGDTVPFAPGPIWVLVDAPLPN